MAQHDYVIANGTGAAVRSDLNNALAAIVSQNSGSTAPATTYAYQWWADTTASVLKLRNAANDGWIEICELDGEFGSKNFNGNITLNAQGDLRFGDSDSSNWVAFQAPGTVSSNVTWTLPSADGTSGQALTTNGSGTLSWTTPSASSDIITEGNTSAEVVDTGSDGHFKVTTEGTEALRVDASRRLLVGTSTNSGGSVVQIQGPSSTAAASIGSLTLRSAYTPISNFTTDIIGKVDFQVADGGVCAKIEGYTNGATVGTNDYPGALLFSTTADGASSPTERCRIDSSGRVLVGATSAPDSYAGLSSQKLTVAGTAYADSSLAVINYQNDSIGGGLNLGHSRNTTIGSHTVVQNGDIVGIVRFSGSDGSGMRAAAFIKAEIDGTPGANDMPGRLVFSTTSDSASSPTERARITSGGYTKISNSGSYVSTTGSYHEFTQTGVAEVLYARNTNASPLGIQIYYGGAAPNGTANEFLTCYDSGPTLRAAFRSNGGLANYSANNANLSDINSKKDISLAADTWDCIKEWEIVNYRYKDQPDDADLNLGVIAQQVAESCPEVVTVFSEAKEAKPAVLDDDGNEVEPAQEAQPEKLGIKEQQMYWMAIKALQEAQVRIEALEAEVAALKAQ